MPVGSVLELYTSILGWFLYDAIWSIFVNTGLIFIPFALAIIGTLLDTRSSQFEMDSKTLIRIIETKVYIMIFVMFFGVNPMINIYPSATKYTSVRCGITSGGSLEKRYQERVFGDSDTTYDPSQSGFVAMLENRIPEAPLWWYLVTKLNHAIAQSARQELPCQADLRKMSSGLSHLNIGDPQVRDETQQFYHDCWKPAANKFSREKPHDDEIPYVLRDNIMEDISWAGSRFFIEKPGYYDTFRTSKELDPENFPYSELRDGIVSPDGYSEGGFPTCDEWWSKSEYGLRSRLLSDLKAGEGSSQCEDCTGAWFKYWSSRWFVNEYDAEDALLKTSLTSEIKSKRMELSTNADSIGIWGTLSEAVASTFTTVGLVGGGLSDSFKTEGIRQVAPIFQAIILLVFTLGLPIFMILGSFNFGSLFALSLTQFSIIFWTFLFALANWLDNFLISGMLNINDKGSTMITYVMFGRDSSADAALEVVAMSWVVRTCYVMVPLAFSVFLGVVGVKTGIEISNMIGRGSSPIGGAGGKLPRLPSR